MLVLWIILFSLLGSFGAIITAAVFLLFQDKTQEMLIPCLISYATGTLLTAALLGLIPRSLEQSSSAALSSLLAGIILFFLLEKLVIWRHCHNLKCEAHETAGTIIIIGDAFHNATDGIFIAAAFLSSVPIGIVAAASVIAHEVPQEVGDFAILLHSGYSKRKAFLLNLLSSLTTLPAAIISYYALDLIKAAIPHIMMISAASFLYIALTDLYPQLHRRIGFRSAVQQFIMMLAGVATIILFLQFHP